MIFDLMLTVAGRAKSRFFYTLHKFIRYFKASSRSGSVTILPHEGLGDLVAILPALQNLVSKGIGLTLVTDLSKWVQIENAFINVPKVNVHDFRADRTYAIPNFLYSKSGSSFIALGHYSKFPIVGYPKSFFWQLGVSQKLVSNWLIPKLGEVSFNLPSAYDFIDLTTSGGVLPSVVPSSGRDTVTSLSDSELLINRGGAEEHVFLDVNASFQQKICVALRAKNVICSDAALFNALIRIETRPNLTVFTRKHRHSHCTEIYKDCRFDGKIYSFPARP
jgi:hypothetical protein